MNGIRANPTDPTRIAGTTLTSALPAAAWWP